MDEDFKRFHEECDFDRNFLKAILYYSRTDEGCKFPTIAKFILAETMNAVMEYLIGNRGDMKCDGSNFPEDYIEEKIAEMKLNLSHQVKRTLSPSIADSILRLIKPYSISPTGPGRPYSTTRLYKICGRYICTDPSSISSFYQSCIHEIENDVLPSLSEQEKEDCQAIGRIMRGYIDADLEYIKETFHW